MNKGQKPKNPWKNTLPKKNQVETIKNKPSSSENKFKDAQKKLQDAVQKHIKEYDSSSDEEEIQADTVISLVVSNYINTGGTVQKTEDYLKDVFQSGASVCLICISKIKRDDEIWSCQSCYCFFHLMCIQRWSKDNIFQKKQALEGIVATKEISISWGCPKCRTEYKPQDIPSLYVCFCGKQVNPKYQALLPPHSCGDICKKSIKPECGHKCLLLCHPGPCPPCPVIVNNTCFCGASDPIPQRCCDKNWSCQKTCNKLLSCGKHNCADLCHQGDCQPCPKKSIQKCMCKSSMKLRECSSPIWQCEKVCGKLLDCGNHTCADICHAGECNVCLLSLPRTCPCGKTKHLLPCTTEVPTCVDTCEKLLECGQHYCALKCHKNNCSPCLETVEKKCRCGLHSKKIQCSKSYSCETKCKNIKDCNKHPCNKKCCDGNCPPCEKPCGKTLSCGNHKCGSICHRGPCYPCNLTESVSCKCGETKLVVPCGRKHRVKPPKCPLPCKVPPDCLHKNRDKHRCHFGNCPPCKQTCGQKHEDCEHICSAVCHSSVLVEIETAKPTAPWEQVKPQKERRALPCPSCPVLVPVKCLGGHEIVNYPCHLAKPACCGRVCGRTLSCGNHSCTFECHIVEQSPDDISAGVNCEVCENACSKERPEGCQHTCPKPCHPGPCPLCKQNLRVKCHCGLAQLYVSCNDYLNKDKWEEILSCKNQCPKNYACGHRCKANCHSGECPNSDLCKKKVKVFCKCKRIKKEINCDTIRHGEVTVNCDSTCLEQRAKELEKKKRQDEEAKRIEDEKNKEEIEKYKKKFEGKKKYRDRRYSENTRDGSFLLKYYLPLSAASIVVVSAIAFIFLSE